MSEMTRLDVGYLIEAVQELTRAVVDIDALLRAAGEGEEDRGTLNERFDAVHNRCAELSLRLKSAQDQIDGPENSIESRLSSLEKTTKLIDAGLGKVEQNFESLEWWRDDHEDSRHDTVNLIGDPTPQVDNPPAQVDKEDGEYGGGEWTDQDEVAVAYYIAECLTASDSDARSTSRQFANGVRRVGTPALCAALLAEARKGDGDA